MKTILSLSGGKDSTAMLLRCIETRFNIDKVVFFDTGWEFPAIYENIEHLKNLCKENDIQFITLYPKILFEDKMFNIEVKHRDGTIGRGYSWCGGVCRWGTTEKLRAIEKHCEGAIELVGLAADEPHRLKKERKGNKRFLLAEWGMTEADALQYCYDRGIHFGGLYKLLDRVSCWCCGNKNLKELRNIYLHMPDIWQRLKNYQSRTDRPFRRDGKTILDLEERFKGECHDK